MELGIETTIEGTILQKGIIALDAKIFSEIVRKLPDNEVILSLIHIFSQPYPQWKDNILDQFPQSFLRIVENGPDSPG